jgi:hypothetical protein
MEIVRLVEALGTPEGGATTNPLILTHDCHAAEKETAPFFSSGLFDLNLDRSIRQPTLPRQA